MIPRNPHKLSATRRHGGPMRARRDECRAAVLDSEMAHAYDDYLAEEAERGELHAGRSDR